MYVRAKEVIMKQKSRTCIFNHIKIQGDQKIYNALLKTNNKQTNKQNRNNPSWMTEAAKLGAISFRYSCFCVDGLRGHQRQQPQTTPGSLPASEFGFPPTVTSALPVYNMTTRSLLTDLPKLMAKGKYASRQGENRSLSKYAHHS